MSNEIYFMIEAAKVTAEVVVDTAVAAGTIAVGAAATTLAAAGFVGASLGSVIHNSAKGVVEIAKLIKEENEIQKKLWENVVRNSVENKDEKSLCEYANRIVEFLKDKDTIVSQDNITSLIKSKKTGKEKLDLAQRLLKIQNSFKSLSNDFYNLNKANEQANCDIDNVVNEYNKLRNNNGDIDELEKQIESLQKGIEEVTSEVRKKIDKKLENQIFVSKGFDIVKEDDTIIPVLFSEEFSKLLEKPKTKEVKSISVKKKVVDMLIKSYNLLETARNLSCFDKYAKDIFVLYNECVKLSKNKKIDEKDLESQVDLKIRSIDGYLSNLNEDEKKSFETKQKYLQVLTTNNYYRKLLGKKARANSFNELTAKKDIEKIIDDNKLLIEKYNKVCKEKAILAELKQLYCNLGYEYVNTEHVMDNSYTTVHCNYFLTPDKKNVLVSQISEDGQVSLQVVGAEIYGLQNDVNGTLNSQKKHCTHTKDILEKLYKKLKVKPKKEAEITEPSLDGVQFVNFDGILPPAAIAKIKKARIAKTQEKSKYFRK